MDVIFVTASRIYPNPLPDEIREPLQQSPNVEPPANLGDELPKSALREPDRRPRGTKLASFLMPSKYRPRSRVLRRMPRSNGFLVGG